MSMIEENKNSKERSPLLADSKDIDENESNDIKLPEEVCLQRFLVLYMNEYTERKKQMKLMCERVVVFTYSRAYAVIVLKSSMANLIDSRMNFGTQMLEFRKWKYLMNYFND